MSRKPSLSPQHGGTFRPRLEALEDRLAPGSLLSDLTGGESNLALFAAAQTMAATQTTSPVVEFANRGVAHGESTLTRTDDGVTMHLTATGVPAGAYTAWWVLFNAGATVPNVGWAAGHVVGEGGKLTIATHLHEGEEVSGDPVFPSGRLQDARQTTIFMVIRYHGPADPGRIHEQTHTFEPTLASNVLIAIHPVP